MRAILLEATWILSALMIVCAPSSAPAQSGVFEAAQRSSVRRLTIDEAVQIALESNLGIQTVRIEPRIQDLAVAQARAAWFPTFTTTVQAVSTDSPNISFLSGAQGVKISDDRFTTRTGVGQTLPWGGTYNIGWDGTRATTTNIFSNFSPQLRSSLTLNYRQPLMRGLLIDTARQQISISEKNREITDITVRQAIAITSRGVRHAYWNLAYALAALDVHRQSLDLARESLRNTRARAEVGTLPPIDIVEAEAEVAQREEAVIIAEAQIASAEDTLRALVYDPAEPEFWTLRIEPISTLSVGVRAVDVDNAVRTALANRGDLQQSRKTLEIADVNIRYFRNQTLPDIAAGFDYGVTGLGGTQFLRGTGFPGPIVGETQRGFGDVLRDVFRNDFPNWTMSLTVSHPIGTTPDEANLARARLQRSQLETQLRNQQLQVATEVREAARRVVTDQKRVETTRLSRQLAERRLEAEERKFEVGTSTSFFVFQAQRDLAQARNNELRAVLDYSRSIVDFETVQEAPLR